jgi:hypothetical protein
MHHYLWLAYVPDQETDGDTTPNSLTAFFESRHLPAFSFVLFPGIFITCFRRCKCLKSLDFSNHFSPPQIIDIYTIWWYDRYRSNTLTEGTVAKNSLFFQSHFESRHQTATKWVIAGILGFFAIACAVMAKYPSLANLARLDVSTTVWWWAAFGPGLAASLFVPHINLEFRWLRSH